MKDNAIATLSPSMMLNRVWKTLDDMRFICQRAKQHDRIEQIVTAQTDIQDLHNLFKNQEAEIYRLRKVEAGFLEILEQDDVATARV